MKKTIWKYVLQVTDVQTVEMPVGSKILDVQMQNNTCCLWALCNSAEGSPKEDRTFVMYGTGHPVLEDHITYMGTLQFSHLQLVFHLFERE